MSLGNLNVSLRLNTADFQAGINRAKKGLYNFYQESVRMNQSIEFGKNIASGVANAVRSTLNAVEQGAKAHDVSEVFKNLSTNMGRDANQMLEELRNASNGYLNEVKGMSLATQSMMSGMKFDDVLVTMEYLQKYAKATGRSFDQLTTTIMTGLARGSTLMLDDAGIIIDAQSVIKQKTDEYGYSLSEVEKKQVLVSAAIEQMKRKMGALNTEQQTAYDGVQRLKAGWEDFKTKMSQLALRAIAFARVSIAGWQAMYYKLKAVFATLVFDVRHSLDFIKQAIFTGIADITNKLASMLFDLRAVAPDHMKGILGDMLTATNNITASMTKKAADTNAAIMEDAKNTLDPIVKESEEKIQEIIKNTELWYKIATGNYNPGGKGTAGSINLDGDAGTVVDEKAARKLETHLDNIIKQTAQLRTQLANIGQDEYIQELNNNAQQYLEMIRGYEGNEQVIAEADKWKTTADALAKARFEMRKTDAEFQAFVDNTTAVADRIKAVFDVMATELADALNEAIDTGRFNVAEFAKNMVKAVRMMSISKALQLTVEGLYHQYLAGVYQKAAAANVVANPALGAAFQAAAVGEQVASSGAFAGAGFFGGLGASLAAGELAGMAHSGITEVPSEGTWLLDKGERVVDSKTNADLKDYLAGGGGSTNIVVNINGGDEQGVLKALPQLKQTIIDVVNGDITQNGTIRQTIKNYT